MASAESVKLGVLTDLSSVYSDSSGNGAIYATEMAVDDLKTEFEAAGIDVTVVSADHHGKPDIGASIAKQWLERDHVDVIVYLLGLGVDPNLKGTWNKEADMYTYNGR